MGLRGDYSIAPMDPLRCLLRKFLSDAWYQDAGKLIRLVTQRYPCVMFSVITGHVLVRYFPNVHVISTIITGYVRYGIK